MTTPTEELARNSGLLECIDDCYLERGDYKEQLQAFREAVEAESDAERMKQPAIGYASPSQLAHLLGDKSVYVDMTLSSDPSAGVPLFKRSSRLGNVASKVCDQCNGDGWNYNAIEGQVPCVCMTEAEPYQQLQRRITMLEAETKMHRANVAHWMKECDALKARLADPAPLLKATEELRTGKEALQQQVKELRGALRNADHSPNCCTRERGAFDEREPCNCGRDAALANTQGEKK